MLRRVGSFVALILVATVVLAACGEPDAEIKPTVTRIPVDNAPVPPTATVPGEQPTAQPGANEGTAVAETGGAQTTFNIAMEDVAFDVTELTVPANTDITINLENKGALTHTFDIDELGVNSGEYASGQKGTVTFNSGAPGEYEYYCAIPGHRESGMVGKLIVTAPESKPAAPAGNGGAERPASPPAGAAASPSASPVATLPTTLDVAMEDIEFNISELKVPANTDITINLVNNGALTHNFSIAELKVDSGDYAAGQAGTITFNSGAPGTYQFFCDVPGHKDLGMVGTLTVVDESAAAGAPPSPSGDQMAAQTSYDLQLQDIMFDLTEMTVPANTEITISVTNTGFGPHNFNIDALNVASGDVAPAATVKVTFNSGAPGTYEYYCNVPGHKELGMVGKLIVQ